MKLNNIIIFILVILSSVFLIEKFSGSSMPHPSSCFSCEKQYGDKFKHLGQSTKCFSCEKDLKENYGPEYAMYGNPSKCFSCEKDNFKFKQLFR